MIGSKKPLTLIKQSPLPTKKIIKVILETIISPLFFNKHIYPFTNKLLKSELTKEQELLNYNLPNFAKKIILNQFKRYSKILKNRQKNAEYCYQELNGLIKFIQPLSETNPSHLYFSILSENRETLIHKLLKEGVELKEMQTFRCLGEQNQKAKVTEKKHLTFALYRSPQEIKEIVQKIKSTSK